MPTLLLFIVIAILFILAIRSLIKSKGACSDCSCDCAIKQQVPKNHSAFHDKL